MSIIPPVVDRTQLDVQLQTDKGFLNIQDYQRIEANLQTLAATFGIQITGSSWSMEDMPTPRRMQSLLDNLQAVRDAYFQTPGTPDTPQLPVVHYETVNDIERIIGQLWHFWSANTAAVEYCGEIYIGDEIGVL